MSGADLADRHRLNLSEGAAAATAEEYEEYAAAVRECGRRTHPAVPR
ncbi:hypothetical protein [Streptomyces sp. CA-132043]